MTSKGNNSVTQSVKRALRTALAAAAICASMAVSAHADISQYVLPTLSGSSEIGADPTGVWSLDPTLGVLHTLTAGSSSVVYPALNLRGLTVAPDGAAWVTVQGANPPGLVRLTVAGPSGSRGTPPAWTKNGRPPQVYQPAASPDGSIWFPVETANESFLARLTPGGTFDEYPFGGVKSVFGDVAATDGAVWFHGEGPVNGVCCGGGSARVTPAGDAAFFSEVSADAAAPNGVMWGAADLGENHVKVDVISPSGVVTELPLPAWVVNARSLAYGPDGAAWIVIQTLPSPDPYRELVAPATGLVRVTLTGSLTYFDLAAPLRQSIPCPIRRGESPRELLKITAASDALWISATEGLACPSQAHGELIRITPTTPGSPYPGSIVPAAQPTTRVLTPIVLPTRELRAIKKAKQLAHTAGQALTALDAVSYTVAGAALLAGQPEITLALIEPDLLETAVSATGGFAFLVVEEDPPDPHFRRLVALQRPRAPRVRANKAIGRPAAQAWSHLVDSGVAFSSATRAAVKSLERAEGAAAAGDCSWVIRQNRAVTRYANLARRTLVAERHLYGALRTVLRRSRLSHTAISSAQFSRAQAQIVREGLPPTASRQLEHFGVPASTTATLIAAIGALQPRTVKVADAITAAPSAVYRFGGALNDLAIGAAAHVKCPVRRHRKH
jgi:hypothetical protein